MAETGAEEGIQRHRGARPAGGPLRSSDRIPGPIDGIFGAQTEDRGQGISAGAGKSRSMGWWAW